MIPRPVYRLFWIIAILSALFLTADTCFHSVNKKQASVLVFEDANRNGKIDRGEAPLADTLALGDFNINGSFRRSGALTDEEGKAVIDAEYTHIFKITVLPPCGAQATTPTNLDATQEKRLHFGFAPLESRPGSASVHFHIWEDRNGNGAQDSGEGPLSNFNLYADPQGQSASESTLYFGILAMQTDAQGNATLDLGNSCGDLMVPSLYRWNYTSISPEPAKTDGGLWFPYHEGVTEVVLGVYAAPTPTPYGPTWTPGDGNHSN
jgi:hypothetical protein